MVSDTTEVAVKKAAKEAHSKVSRSYSEEGIARFAHHYIQIIMETGKTNGAEAARRAGYAAKTAHVTAWKILQMPPVKELLAQVAFEQAKQLSVDGDLILKELAGIAFSPITPGYVSAADKNKALHNLGVHHKLWEGSKGNKVININILAIDEKLL